MPVMANAASYTITDQYIQAEIQDNGDLKISELIVMEGTFNGYVKQLSYANDLLMDEYSNYENNAIYNADGIDLISIKGKLVDEVDFDTFSDTDFKDFVLDYSASNGDVLKYTSVHSSHGYDYTLYYAANHDKVAFLITYMVDRVVVLHDDIAELYWNFIIPNEYDDIENVHVRVYLPRADASDQFRVWAHGDLSGEVKILEDRTGVEASIPHMESTSVLDLRLTFNRDLITDTSKVKVSHDMALDGIIEVEEQRALVANQLRDELLAKRTTAIWISWILIVGIVSLGIFIYFKYGKSPKSHYFSKYNREFIDDYNVEVIDYLMNRKITPNALSASIMNLVYKKNIQVEEIASGKKKDKDYEFNLIHTDQLDDSEIMLVEFLFDTVGKNKINEKKQKTFTTKDLKSYASGTKTCNTFIKSYTAWKNHVLQKGIDEKFFETSGVPKIFGMIVLAISIFFLMFIIHNGIDYIPSYVAILLSVVFFIYTLVLYKKTQKGSDHYARWKAFRNFLNDFGSFELKELPEIILWERYLVYATVFGLADKVEQSMNVYINEMDLSNLPDGYYPMFTYIHISPMIYASFNQALNSAYSRQAANYANTHSSRSSGGGFGGGFSSGGGFGGGGSSGHGF